LKNLVIVFGSGWGWEFLRQLAKHKKKELKDWGPEGKKILETGKMSH